MKGRAAVVLAAVVAASLVLRAVPTLTSGEPFSLDAWPLIKGAQVIAESPSVRIWNDSVLGGYNNRWPGTLLTSVTYSLISGVSVTDTYRFFGPLATVLPTLLLVYAIVRRTTGEVLPSLLALTYFAFAPSLLIFTSATIKEVCAYPLLYSLIFLLTAPQLGFSAFVVATLVLATSISATHPLASFMAAGLGFSTSLVYAMLSAAGKEVSGIRAFSLGRSATLALLVTAVFAAYLLTYGGAGFRYSISVGDVLTYITYAIFVYLTYLLFNMLRRWKSALAILIFTAVAALLALAPHRSLLPGLGAIKSLTVMLYAVPAVLPLLTAVKLPKETTSSWIYAAGALLLVAVNSAYVALAKPEMSSIFHRVANYVVPANALLLAHSIARSSRLKPLALAIVAVTAACSVVAVASVVAGLDGVTYYWYFRGSEVYSLNAVNALASKSIEFLGDAKVAYYFSLTRPVYSSTFLKALVADSCSSLKDSLVLLYKDNFTWGYVISLNTIDIASYLSRIYCLSKVFDGSTLYAFTFTG